MLIKQDTKDGYDAKYYEKQFLLLFRTYGSKQILLHDFLTPMSVHFRRCRDGRGVNEGITDPDPKKS